MVCKACEERGKVWGGDAPKCGFETGVFDSSNWNCATIGELRNLADEKKVYNEEQYCSIIPIPGSPYFIVLNWYKSRGRTDLAIVMTDEGVLPLTIEIAESVIKGEWCKQFE